MIHTVLLGGGGVGIGVLKAHNENHSDSAVSQGRFMFPGATGCGIGATGTAAV